MARTVLVLGIVALLAMPASADTVVLTNNLAGTNEFTVHIDENGYSTQAYIQAPGEVRENLMYEYFPVFDVGGSAERMTGGTWLDDDPSDGSVISSGSTLGISWTVTHTLASGGSVMASTFVLQSEQEQTLPAMRVFMYLDEDVYSITNNILVRSGSIAGGNLELLTVHPDIRAGVSQAGDANATGWAADQYWYLREDLLAGGFDASASGTVNETRLPPIVDPYYGAAWGPRDITTAIEWEITSGLRFYSFTAYLGGLPVAPPPVVPEPATLVLLGTGLAGLGVRQYRSKRADKS